MHSIIRGAYAAIVSGGPVTDGIVLGAAFRFHGSNRAMLCSGIASNGRNNALSLNNRPTRCVRTKLGAGNDVGRNPMLGGRLNEAGGRVRDCEAAFG